MRLDSLRVLHLPKVPPTADARDVEALQAVLPEGIFCLDSCQRWLWICAEQDIDLGALPEVPGLRILGGADAYLLLLRVATGLESQIVGETDIFGQLKQAWQKAGAGLELGTLMQKIFEDTKEIRSRHIQGIGGASYGSLVRMLLRGRPGATLLVGAGQIARSVAPYLLDGELWLANRGVEGLASLHAELATRLLEQGRSTESLQAIPKDAETRAWREAANVVVCIPMDELSDPERVALRLGREGGAVIHLGGLHEQAGEWKKLPVFHSLDDLFALEKAQGDARTEQIRQAGRACEERAKLRALGASVSIPHGWEDLAVFA